MSKINCQPTVIAQLALVTTCCNAPEHKLELVPEKVCRRSRDVKDTLFTRTEKISYQYPNACIHFSIDTSYFQYYGNMINILRSTIDRTHLLLCLTAPNLRIKIHLIRDTITYLAEMDPAYPNPFEINGEPPPLGSYVCREGGRFENIRITYEEYYKGLPTIRNSRLLNSCLFDKNDQYYLRIVGRFYNLSLD